MLISVILDESVVVLAFLFKNHCTRNTKIVDLSLVVGISLCNRIITFDFPDITDRTSEF